MKIQIPNLEEEKKYFNKLGITQKPKNIYLDYCNKYSAQHLNKHEHEIDDYVFKIEDVLNGSFSRDVIRWI